MLKFNVTIHDWEIGQSRTVFNLTLAKAWRIAEHYRRRALRQYDYVAATTRYNWGWSVGDMSTGKYCSAVIKLA